MAKDLLLEIGCEEIPASFIDPALDDMHRVFSERCLAARLEHGAILRYGTPRRLALLIKDVAEKSQDVTREVSGPSLKAAYDKDGKPTKAAEKFAESQGLKVEQLLKLQTPKGEYLGAKVEEKGRTAQETLKEVLHQVVHSINFKKSMRWGDVELAFARPVHWVVALFGAEVLPVVLGDVKSGKTTFGHRFLAPGAIPLESPAGYVETLRAAHVIVDVAERKQLTLQRVQAAAAQSGGKLLEDPDLLDQVTHLVELPNPVVGSFDARHLDLPPEVLVQEMKSHQRYFSLVDGAGKLLPKFIAVSNTPVKDEKLSLRGYERVLRARLADGRFFFDEDRKVKLQERLPKLERVVWQGKLGSYAEKVSRVQALAAIIGQAALGNRWTPALHQTVDRAAQLSKADLVTGMVGEFPELQGVMGREYAKASGESEEVAQAIYEHYLPRHQGDALPTTDAGAFIGLADRVDSLVGLFGIGKKPSGAADQFGLRRAALAVLNLLLARGYRLSLSTVVEAAVGQYGEKLSGLKRKPGEPPVKDEVMDFFRARLKPMWSEQYRTDVVEAVLSAGFDDVVSAHKRLEALGELVGREDFAPLAIAFKRVANIVEKQGKDVSGGTTNPQKFTDEPERHLHRAYTEARGKVSSLVKTDDFAGALKEITALKPAVDTFFDKVMVMAEDQELRENRIRFLTEIGALFGQVADFTKIQAEG